MATTYSKDLYRQTSFTRGVKDSDDTRATIAGVVNLDASVQDGRQSLEAAADAAASARGPYHPDEGTLPLRTATAFHRSVGKATVFLQYAHDADSKYTSTYDGTVIADVSVGFRSVNRYRQLGVEIAWGTAGTPTYVPLIEDVNAVEPVWSVRVPFKLGYSPIPTVGTFAGKVNSGVVSYSGGTFAANTVRFDGLHMAPVLVGGTVEFEGVYSFSIAPVIGWTHDILNPNVAAASAAVGTANDYVQVSFGSGFPT